MKTFLTDPGASLSVLFLNPLHPTRLPPRPLPALSTIVLFYIFGSPSGMSAN